MIACFCGAIAVCYSMQVVYLKGDIVKTEKLTHSNSPGASFQKQQAESDPRVDFGATLGYCKQDTTTLL